MIKKGVPIYKHLDGYPSNVLYLLREYLQYNKDSINDISYLSASFLRYVQEWGYKELPEEMLNHTRTEFESTYEEVIDKDHYTEYGLFEQNIDKDFITNTWEDYFYKITPHKIYVYIPYHTENIDGFGKHPKCIWECEMNDFLELPCDGKYFEELQDKITN